jgi:uncharacterized membrane protein YedE/YeeE
MEFIELDWILAFIGGLIIGLGGVLYLLGNGRIMGASGILGGLIDGTGWWNWSERFIWILSVALAPFLLSFFWVERTETNLTNNISILIISGLLVGLGTRLANGCTSGHGVCGMSRLSLRGFVATIFYIGAGAITVALVKHVWEII